MAFARDIMSKEIIVARVDDGIQKVSRILTEKCISNIPIVSKKDELTGIVSEQDIIKAMKDKNFMKMCAKDVMTTNITSLKENDSLEYISKIFTERPYRRLPVVRNKKVVGAVTRESIISTFMSDYY